MFKEVIDFKGKELEFKQTSSFVLPSAHAPYTVSAKLIKEIKKYCTLKKGVFTIHCAESEEEVEFLKTGSGGLAELLKERGRLSKGFTPPGLSPVEYLHALGVLDESTLLVHCVCVSERDVEHIKKS